MNVKLVTKSNLSILFEMDSMKSFIKYPGGKARELKHILNALPPTISNYYEPFVGGGSVLFSLNDLSINDYFINDTSQELIGLYQSIKFDDTNFFNLLNSLNDLLHFLIDLEDTIEFKNSIKDYNESILDPFLICSLENQQLNHLLSLFSFTSYDFIESFKIESFRRFKKLSIYQFKMNKIDVISSAHTSLHAALFVLLRKLYNKISFSNKALKLVLYYYIREFSYSGMFRYNSSGSFNAPYGGFSYNKKTFDEKLKQISNKGEINNFLKNVNIYNNDFETFFDTFLLHNSDFIFLDPPYDSNFSSYSNNAFTQDDHERLANFLKTKCIANFMLVIKKTDFIDSLYSEEEPICYSKKLHVYDFSNLYSVNFKSRNDRQVTHLLVTNY